MDALVHWLASGMGPVAAFSTMAVALLVTALAPRHVKRRMRGALILGFLYGVLTLISTRMSSSVEGHFDVRAIAFLCGALAIARFAFVLGVDLIIERAGAKPMNQLTRDILQTVVYLFAGAAALRAAKIPPTSLIATGTVVTAIVGLALQETLGNLAAGVSIQIDKPIALGDWIHIDKGEYTGRVVSTNWRAVSIQTDDRALFVIPNGVFSKTPFMNHSRPGGGTRRTLYFTLPYDVPPTHAHEAILAACADAPDVHKEPKASVLTWTYTDRGVTYWLRFFIADFARRDIAQGDVGTRVWFHLNRRKIHNAIPEQRQFVYEMDEAALANKSAEGVKDRRAAIDAVDFLRALSDDARDTLARRGHRKLFAPGETIIRAGETGREFYIIRRGTVAIVVADGHEVAKLKSGDFFGELALLTGTARHASVVAKEETEVLEVDEAMFKDVLHSEPTIAEAIARIVGERQAELEARRSGAGAPSTKTKEGASGEILRKIRTLFALD